MRFILWHHRRMRKSAKKRDSGDGARGIIEAATQDIELTIEQAEDAAKKAAHATVVALGLASDDAQEVVGPRAGKRPAPAKKPTPSRAPRRKPQR